MYWSSCSPEHRARELLNLVYLAQRCARLPAIDEDERRAWQSEADRAWAMAQPLLPGLRARGTAAREVVAVAEGMAEEMSRPRQAWWTA